MPRLSTLLPVAAAIGLMAGMYWSLPARNDTPHAQASGHRELPAKRQKVLLASASDRAHETTKPRLMRLPARSADVRPATLTFRDGTKVEVVFRPLRLPSVGRPQNLADIHEELVELSTRGDADAALSLYRWLNECEHAFPDAASLSKAIRRLERERALTDPALPDRTLSASVSVEDAAAAMQQVFEFCQGITEDQRRAADGWLNVAATAGDLFALDAKARSLLRQSSKESRAAYESLWKKNGYSSALSPLAIIHMRSDENEPADYKTAYAYMLIEYKLVEAVYGVSVFPAHRAMLAAMQDGMAKVAGNLSPEQTLEAEKLAAVLVQRNGRCCTGALFGITN